jgi:hypothetical protein
MPNTRVEVFSLIGEYCLLAEDGEKVRSAIEPFLKLEGHVTIDFGDVKVLTATFLNAAVGRLLDCPEPRTILEKLKFANLDNVDANLLGLVLKNAVRFYSLTKEQQAAIIKATQLSSEQENERQDQAVP